MKQILLDSRSVILEEGKLFNNVIAWMIALAICTLHFGVNEFISVQFLAFVFIFLMSIKNIVVNIEFWVIFVLFSLLYSIGVFVSGQEPHFYLVGFRSALILSILSVMSGVTLSERVFNNVITGLIYSIAIVDVWAILQLLDTLTSRTGIFDPPEGWYSLDYGTIRENLMISAENSSSFVRSSAGFSEPSAMAALGVMGFLVGIYNNNRVLKILSVLCVALSASLSGMIFLIGLVFLQKSDDQGLGLLKRFLALFISLIVLFYIAGERFNSINSGNDLSSMVRIFEPLRLIFDSIGDGVFFGQPKDEITYRSSEVTFTVFDNWILNQILLYGFVGLLIVGLAIYIAPRKLVILLIVYGIMNGDALYYDRFILMALFIYCTSFYFRFNRGAI